MVLRSQLLPGVRPVEFPPKPCQVPRLHAAAFAPPPRKMCINPEGSSNPDAPWPQQPEPLNPTGAIRPSVVNTSTKARLFGRPLAPSITLGADKIRVIGESTTYSESLRRVFGQRTHFPEGATRHSYVYPEINLRRLLLGTTSTGGAFKFAGRQQRLHFTCAEVERPTLVSVFSHGTRHLHRHSL
jgi:hypothetical protein